MARKNEKAEAARSRKKINRNLTSSYTDSKKSRLAALLYDKRLGSLPAVKLKEIERLEREIAEDKAKEDTE